jgi:Domain of unknown function (DUF4375)
MFEFKSRFSSVAELLQTDAAETLDDGEFDDQLWLLLTSRIESPADLRGLPAEVGVYYASRLLQWEVDNGGFAQAAGNIPEWFSLAEAGYLALGKSKAAVLIRKARGFLSEDDDELSMREDMFEQLDAELSKLEWEIDVDRVRYVRQHRSVFVDV